MEQFLYSLPGFRWQDALDIFFNAYILFRLYVLFRGTNVFRVLMAVVFLWIISRAAASLGLIITSWAMQGVITAATFVIIIVFRNEISSVVRTRDLKSFLWGIPRYQVNTPVQIIVDSVRDLLERKIGALIVLPLKQNVDNIVKSGVAVNARLSREMLVSIFWPDNPLHDGAAVIQGNRIARCGVILPLSQNTDLSSGFGTRHRAAVGLTELTDAMVIVVSEERRRASLLWRNKIHPIQDPSDLVPFLKTTTQDSDTPKGFRRHTLELLAAGAFCLLCTTGLWYSFSRGMETLSTYEVPIEFMNPDPKMKIKSTSVSEAKLLIAGARPLIKALEPGQMTVKLPLGDTVVGKNTLPVSQADITLPPGIRLKKIEPPEVEVTLDTMMGKEVVIQPEWTGKLPDGYIMRGARTIPESIVVIGGELALKEISTVFTTKIPLDGFTESGTVTVDLVLTPPTLKIEGTGKVQVQYFIAQKLP